MSRATATYLERVRELALARLDHELRHEPFTQEVEVEYISELDHWWREMRHEEQDAIERQLAGQAPDAPSELPTEDVDVDIGSESGPRR